jgi:hypothetical protein
MENSAVTEDLDFGVTTEMTESLVFGPQPKCTTNRSGTTVFPYDVGTNPVANVVSHRYRTGVVPVSYAKFGVPPSVCVLIPLAGFTYLDPETRP